jgi:hypothetical protein
MLHVRGFVATLLLVAAFCPNPAGADGAVAVGLPADVAKDGVSIKGKVNFETPDTAKAAALKGCQTPPLTSVSGTSITTKTGKLCKIVSSFHDQCFAYAFDPQDGTPGFGWAVANDQRGAEKQALENCENTAGPGRRAACKVVRSECDGSAK